MARSDGTTAAGSGKRARRGATSGGGGADRPSDRSTRPIANPLNAGEGILRRMAELNDHPMRDAEFLRNGDGSLVEQCWGTKGLYMASNATGSWEVAGPFGGGA